MKIIIALLSLTLSLGVSAAPKSELWPHWNKSNENNNQTITHTEWDNLLNKYVVSEGQHTLFKYTAISREDKEKLEYYLEKLSSVTPQQYSKNEQYAYWVNLYNAITVNIVLDNYPVKSITKIGGLFSFGPWEQEVITIDGKKLTLNDIEHRILRPIWQDPRTHYVLNCASLGCPNLQPMALTADNTNALLEQAAYQFISSDKGAYLTENKLLLSSIYDWFKSDFGTEEELFKHLGRYRPDLSHYKGKVSYEYDWQLNSK
ncbi:DUF547 domain-containing protein [Vibrio sp. YMD68]|uniref:DUF547 domain-containing protein n=1 Tax=Vibrio sp. YMD68 TaxID=3042300 RepID=UPI00249ADA39|nr:DUF547 domain-containing protein [Vibrio sp. YMD68]WGW00743.1 DUF547 domain-containing protein [Vibrio sp. YMD68]